MKTVIIGASPNTDRTAYQAAQLLEKNGIDFVPVGIKSGEVLGKNILTKEERWGGQSLFENTANRPMVAIGG